MSKEEEHRGKALYGKQYWNPEEKKEYRKRVEKEISLRKNHIYFKNELKDAPASEPTTYFNTHKAKEEEYLFDRVFSVKEGYCNKCHRDDKKCPHSNGQAEPAVLQEERGRVVPVRSSSEYGHRPAIDNPHNGRSLVNIIEKDFFRARGTNLQDPNGAF
eukprot:Opistho-2@61638